MSKKDLSIEDLQDWLIAKLAKTQELPEDEIDIKKAFSKYGMDSVTTIEISGELEELLGIKLEPTTLFEFSTIERLAKHLYERTHQ